ADGRFLAYTGQLGARVWDIATGEAVTPLLRASGQIPGVWTVEFSPGGHALLTGANNATGEVREWSLLPDARPVEGWEAIVEALSGLKLGKQSTEVLPREVADRAWEKMRALKLGWLGKEPLAPARWHRRLAESC